MSAKTMAFALSAIAFLQGALTVPYAQAPSAPSAPANFWSSVSGPSSANAASAGPSAAAGPPSGAPSSAAQPAGPVPTATTSISFPAAFPSVTSANVVASNGPAKGPTAPVGPPLPMRTLTAADIIAIEPGTKGPCDSAQQHPNECTTADHAAPLIQQSFNKYGITHPSVQAAVLSTIIWESGSFKYNTNLKNATAQGTRNMMSRAFVEEFGKQYGNMDFDAVIKNKTLSFETAAWYITVKCDFSIRQGLWKANKEAYSNYALNCLGAGDLDKRTPIWGAGINRLGDE